MFHLEYSKLPGIQTYPDLPFTPLILCMHALNPVQFYACMLLILCIPSILCMHAVNPVHTFNPMHACC